MPSNRSLHHACTAPSKLLQLGWQKLKSRESIGWSLGLVRRCAELTVGGCGSSSHWIWQAIV